MGLFSGIFIHSEWTFSHWAQPLRKTLLMNPVNNLFLTITRMSHRPPVMKHPPLMHCWMGPPLNLHQSAQRHQFVLRWQQMWMFWVMLLFPPSLFLSFMTLLLFSFHCRSFTQSARTSLWFDETTDACSSEAFTPSSPSVWHSNNWIILVWTCCIPASSHCCLLFREGLLLSYAQK